MTPIAHAGHWAAQLLYLAPMIAMVVSIAVAKLRARRPSADDDAASDPESPAGVAQEGGDVR